jgi:hypothetical protein
MLPTTVFGRIRTGNLAKADRIHSGLMWPPEARIESGNYLRRVPISYAWRMLVEAGDSPLRWGLEGGVSIPVSRILAAHLQSIIISENHRDDDVAVIAIPNNLDEFGQDELLSELRDQGIKNPLLIWRPVAAALAWLDKIQDYLPEPGKNDAIIVIYMGPDGFEFVHFLLRARYANGRRYIIPLRSRPNPLMQWSGLDWAARLIQETWNDLTPGALWQALTNFPEVWFSLAELRWPEDKLPRPWSVGDGWIYWNPPNTLANRVWDVKPERPATLNAILGKSCPSRRNLPMIFENWRTTIETRLVGLIESLPESSLVGMIVCGPLAPANPPCWLKTLSNPLTKKGLKLNGPFKEPQPNNLWLPNWGNDFTEPLATGAAIFGNRNVTEPPTPTYLDTLPQLSIYAMKQCQYDWIPLVEASEWEGGREYHKEIEGEFRLPRKQPELEVFLKKGDEEGLANEFGIPTFGLRDQLIKVAQQKVRGLGSLRAVLSSAGLSGNSNYEQYARAFAKTIYSEAEGLQLSLRKPYRRAKFSFPSAPDEDKVLDIHVRMKPASGTAKVEIKPWEASFLRGRPVFLDYTQMTPIEDLGEFEKGAPDIIKQSADPSDGRLLSEVDVLETFNSVRPPSNQYFESLREVKDLITSSTRILDDQGFTYRRVLDQDGRVGTKDGQLLIDRLSAKISEDFEIVRSLPGAAVYNQKFYQTTWLFLSTPENIVNYLSDVLSDNFAIVNNWNWVIEAASRSFRKASQFHILFGTICDRINSGQAANPFPINSARSVWRVLAFRERGFEALERNQAELLVNQSVQMMEDEASATNFDRRYFQAARLFFFLLRFRCKDGSFLNPENLKDKHIFDRAKECLQNAKTFFKIRQQMEARASRAQEILSGIESYMYFRGKGVIIFDDFVGSDNG